MSDAMHRRQFLSGTLATGAALTALGAVKGQAVRGANQKVVVAVMGTNGRGQALARGFAQQPNCEVAYICDVDQRALAKGIKATVSHQQRQPKGITDFRKALDDKSVDVLACATPNHWHAPATILGCKAGKHVYVEKPCCHNPREGELMVQAARKYKRVVQMGNQRRSFEKVIEAIDMVRGGTIGRVYYSRGWYANTRPSIKYGKKNRSAGRLGFRPLARSGASTPV